MDTFKVTVGVGSPSRDRTHDETYQVSADGYVHAAFLAGMRCGRIGFVVWRIANVSSRTIEWTRVPE